MPPDSNAQVALAPAAGVGFGKVVADALLAHPDFAGKMVAAILDGLVAVSRYFDMSAKKMVEVPDFKTRIATFRMVMDHLEGEPIKRIVTQHLNEPGAEKTLEARLMSPALRAELRKQLEDAERVSAKPVAEAASVP